MRYWFVILLAGCGSGSDPQVAHDVEPIQAAPVGRQEVACPAQTPDMMVILAFGQSNSANSLEKRHSSDHVINFFQGKCFLAQDPLFGPTDTGGSMWTLMADKLGKPVVLIAIGRRATTVGQWETNPWLDDAMKTPYQITHFLWHQGESDAFVTSRADYAASLNAIIGRTKTAFPASKFYVSIASLCRAPADPEIQEAQKSVIGPGVFQGPNTDLYDATYRYDGCHFKSTAQELISDEWVGLLH